MIFSDTSRGGAVFNYGLEIFEIIFTPLSRFAKQMRVRKSRSIKKENCNRVEIRLDDDEQYDDDDESFAECKHSEV